MILAGSGEFLSVGRLSHRQAVWFGVESLLTNLYAAHNVCPKLHDGGIIYLQELPEGGLRDDSAIG